MAEIPSFDEWKKQTYSLTSPRSEFLVKLDASIQAYEKEKSPGNRQEIKTALDRWRFEQSKAGKDWRKSVRNQQGAVTSLYRAVNDLDRRNLSKDEIEAMQFISRAQAMALQKQFEGRKLTFKPNTLAGMAAGAGSNWQKFKTGAGAVKTGISQGRGIAKQAGAIKTGADLLRQGGAAAAANAASASATGNISTIKSYVTQFCQELCPGVDPNQVFSALHLGDVEKFASDLAPFIGAISSGGKAVVGWIGVAKTGWEKHTIAGTRYAFAPRDPEAAFDALLVLLDREMASRTAGASVKTVGFTGKLLGAFADGGAVTGPVIGLMETLAEIFQTIVEYVRDYKEMEAANKLLQVGALNFDLFNDCPILGCYFLVIQDHSTIINFAVGDYGTPDFVFDVERLIKKIDPALTKARFYIHASRLEIAGFQHSKGVVEQNWSAKGGLDKVTGLPAHVKKTIAGKIDAWFEKPVKLPKVDKSRIVGFGSNT
jgi:hypothetical protein